MNIIDKVEIRYFRSLYTVEISNINHLNVISGSNDVGKSNILKALNLYFEGFTDWSNSIRFYSDVNKYRLQEVRSESIKGKQIIWIAITFDIPQDSYSGSLPEKVRVKKKWDRYNNVRTENKLDTKDKRDKLPSSRKVANRFLSHFLNKIEFEYIPAVRDKEFRLHLLKRLQNYILKEEANGGLSDTVNDLADHMKTNIDQLRDDFERISGINSTMSPPDDITSLFKSFNVSTLQGQKFNIPLEQRGDGIQSQYLVSVLRHLCSGDGKYHIWAFEEPENSLEYSRVKSLTNDLKQDCKNAQIFVTTHSPALIDIDDKNSNVFRTYKSDGSHTNLSKLDEDDNSGSLSSDIGLQKLKSDVYEDFKKLADKVDLLESINTDKILTEGKTDAQIIRKAYIKLYDSDPPFRIEPADPGSGGGATTLSKFAEATKESDRHTTISIFDRDEEGVREFNNLSNNFDYWGSREDVKVHQNGSSYAILLPIPQFRNDSDEVCIEKLFEDDVLKTTNDNGDGIKTEPINLEGLKYDNGEFIKPDQKNQALQNAIQTINEEVSNGNSDDFHIVGGKFTFAFDIVPNLDRDNFYVFNQLFDTIFQISGD